ncbi:MAG: imidazole glycerol phosphate synthase subunit HisH [Bacillota bacterium]|nr:imidazole glycerol phosphate synthase subunit HisH [Bacillota bacterium]
MSSLVIIDSACANLNSIYKAAAKADLSPVISDDPQQISNADAIIFPGVGSFAHASGIIESRGLTKALLAAISRNIPFLGICLGMQLLFSESEETGENLTDVKGLDVIAGKARRFPDGLPVPHVGWNQVEPVKDNSLFEGLGKDTFFYFTHSYYVQPDIKENTLALTEYGFSFTSAVNIGNLYGVQFHPEKSGPAGLRLLSNFGKIIADQR